MIGNSLIIQIGMAGLAIGIIVTYIQPTFIEIKNRQDQLVQTKEELQKVNAVNQRLAQLYSSVNDIPQTDKIALSTYIPDEIDEIKVLKDLYIISDLAKVLVTNLRYTGLSNKSNLSNPNEEAVPKPKAHAFNLAFTSSYEDFKQMLALLEKNNYALDIESVTVTPGNDGLLMVDLEIVTYSVK